MEEVIAKLIILSYSTYGFILFPAHKYRLEHFSLTAVSISSSDLAYSFTDPGEDGQAIYTVVPSPRINFPVSQVRFDKDSGGDKILTLCEVFIYGGRWSFKYIVRFSYLPGVGGPLNRFRGFHI